MNTEMTKLENVKKSCKVASTVAKIIRIICIVALVVCVFGVCACLGLKDQINQQYASNAQLAENTNLSVAYGNVELTGLFVDMMEKGEYAEAFAICAGVMVVALIFAIVVILLIEKIFTAILKNSSPFDDVVIKAMRRAFILLTVFTLISSGLGGAVILALFFWCIYTIFQYGAELQKQSDETL